MNSRRFEMVLSSEEHRWLTLDALARHAGMHPALVKRFVDFGLVEPIEWEDTELVFDASAIPRLRTIARLRESLGINLPGISVILDLLDRLRSLQRENARLRANFQ